MFKTADEVLIDRLSDYFKLHLSTEEQAKEAYFDRRMSGLSFSNRLFQDSFTLDYLTNQLIDYAEALMYFDDNTFDVFVLKTKNKTIFINKYVAQDKINLFKKLDRKNLPSIEMSDNDEFPSIEISASLNQLITKQIINKVASITDNYLGKPLIESLKINLYQDVAEALSEYQLKDFNITYEETTVSIVIPEVPLKLKFRKV